MPFLILSDRWGIGADKLQWIVYRRYGDCAKGYKWQPCSFIASTKAILQRCLHEKGAIISPEGQLALDALPSTFQDWANSHLGRGLEAA